MVSQHFVILSQPEIERRFRRQKTEVSSARQQPFDTLGYQIGRTGRKFERHTGQMREVLHDGLHIFESTDKDLQVLHTGGDNRADTAHVDVLSRDDERLNANSSLEHCSNACHFDRRDRFLQVHLQNEFGNCGEMNEGRQQFIGTDGPISIQSQDQLVDTFEQSCCCCGVLKEESPLRFRSSRNEERSYLVRLLHIGLYFGQIQGELSHVIHRSQILSLRRCRGTRGLIRFREERNRRCTIRQREQIHRRRVLHSQRRDEPLFRLQPKRRPKRSQQRLPIGTVAVHADVFAKGELKVSQVRQVTVDEVLPPSAVE